MTVEDARDEIALAILIAFATPFALAKPTPSLTFLLTSIHLKP
jgi:hypothetical protein